MIVYKFGGASVRSAAGIQNIAKIVSEVKEPLFVIVSAMGKTTNALEIVHEHFMNTNKQEALTKIEEIKKYHYDICTDIFNNTNDIFKKLDNIFSELKEIVNAGIGTDFDQWYDQIVSFGEIVSTAIISEYLNKSDLQNQWLDMRKLLVTDSNFREANVNMQEAEKRLSEAVDFSTNDVYLSQGFIGTNKQGNPTTLGREGSDYSAAVVGSLLQANSVTIWKDVPGILNADPREFTDTILIPQLTYRDAVELAFSGAQVIHPKTIKPLRNTNTPLYVRPFNAPNEQGTVIQSTIPNPIDVPVFILKKDVILITLRPIDFSFALEESLSKLFVLTEKHRLKVSLIQSSAVSISICVDNSRYIANALDELANDFKVSYNNNLELLTIRRMTPKAIEQGTKDREIILKQSTRRNCRILMKSILLKNKS